MLGIASTRGISAEEAQEIFEETRRDAEESGNLRAHAFALSNYAHVRVNVLGGGARSAVELNREAVELARQSGDSILLAVLETRLGLTFNWQGRFRDGLEVCRQALERLPVDLTLVPATYGLLPQHQGFSNIARSLVMLGHLEEAATFIGAHLDSADAAAGPYDAWTLQSAHALLSAETGDWAEAARFATAAVKSAEASGSFAVLMLAQMHLGYVELSRQNWRDALAWLERAGALMERAGMFSGAVASRRSAHLAEIHLELGTDEQARSAADAAITIACDGEFRGVEPLAHLARARVLLRLEGATAREAIEAALAQAQAVARETEARLYEPSILCERAALAQLLGDKPACQRHLRAAQSLWLELGAPLRARQIARELEAK